MKYITIRAFAQQTGYTEKAIYKKKAEHWTEGVHYIKAPDGRILINVEEYEKWVEGSAVAQKAPSKSHSNIRASVAVRRSHLSPRLAT
ncbi:hypothetical protein [Pelistega sp. MC2]|uniref:hypothetical protein n=1 Tax=Pelistega sp. MC2 TaxID=1720297 RepID=UPI0009F1F1EE|nr:hypothetical protein [Pelistega sp. MC2]